MLFGRRRIEKRHNFPRMRSKIDRRRSRQQVLGGSRSHSLRISRHDTTRIAIWTLYLRTLCFGTIVPDLVLDLGSAGWVIPSRYIQSPQPSRPRSLLLRLGPLLSDICAGRSRQSRPSSSMKSLPGRDIQPCRMADVIGSRCCRQHGLRRWQRRRDLYLTRREPGAMRRRAILALI